MNKLLEQISLIGVIKEKLKLNKFINGTELMQEFLSLGEIQWRDINNIDKDNLDELCSFHRYLIEEVCQIHTFEEDDNNKVIFCTNQNFKVAQRNLIDGKRTSNIYSFNDENYEYFIVGDLHSDNRSILKILDKCDFFNSVIGKKKIRLIFLGDYVDRGKLHLRTLETVLCLKLIFSENIFLLRGNHDGGSIINGEIKLSVGKPKDDPDEYYFLLYLKKLIEKNSTFKFEMIDVYIRFFDSLPYLAFISQNNICYLGVHGGLPRPIKEEENSFSYIKCISDLTNTNIIDNIGRTITHNMMWSDPAEGEEDLRMDSGRFKFTHKDFEEFRKLIGIDILLRGHEAEADGYKAYYNEKLYTIFSSGAIIENGLNINESTYYEEVTPAIGHILCDGSFEIISV